jgi:hypothetical protein
MDKERVSRLQDNSSQSVRIKERLKKGVFFTHVGLVRRMMRLEFGAKFENYIEKRHAAYIANSRMQKAKSNPPPQKN